MNEFQIASQQDELEALRAAKASFDQAVPQPFLSPQDSGVANPRWGKAVIEATPSDVNTSGGGSAGPTFLCVIGINDAGTFRPATAFVSGPVTYL